MEPKDLPEPLRTAVEAQHIDATDAHAFCEQYGVDHSVALLVRLTTGGLTETDEQMLALIGQHRVLTRRLDEMEQVICLLDHRYKQTWKRQDERIESLDTKLSQTRSRNRR